MVNFFHRTASHKIYEIILQQNSSKVEKISKKMLKLGHKRKLSDIAGMVKLLEHFGLLEEDNRERAQILIKADSEHPQEALVYLANQLLII